MMQQKLASLSVLTRTAAFAVVFACLFFSPKMHAQETLPKGIGLYQFGMRNFVDQEVYYNGLGEKVTLGSKLDKDFTGQNILDGAGGPLLKRLADELRKLDVQSAQGSQILNQLNLGSLRGDITGKVSARFIGLGFGLTDKITLFIGAPYVTASVDADMELVGENTANKVIEYLGDAPYPELKDGLRKAADLNIGQIKQSILDNGYQDISHWDHSGWGDFRIGARTGFTTYLGRPVKLGLGLSTTLEIPTGYKDDPDILTDVPTSKGYYALTFQGDPRLKLFDLVTFGLSGSYSKNFATTAEKRVPENEETIMGPDRKATVNLTPGSDYMGAGIFGLGTSVIGGEVRAGFTKHNKDVYDGAMKGNYEALAKESEKKETFYEYGATLSTATLYQKKKFPVPFILTGVYHVATMGQNFQDNRYYEISLASFFPTPLADKPKKEESKRVKKKRRRIDR